MILKVIVAYAQKENTPIQMHLHRVKIAVLGYFYMMMQLNKLTMIQLLIVLVVLKGLTVVPHHRFVHCVHQVKCYLIQLKPQTNTTTSISA